MSTGFSHSTSIGIKFSRTQTASHDQTYQQFLTIKYDIGNTYGGVVDGGVVSSVTTCCVGIFYGQEVCKKSFNFLQQMGEITMWETPRLGFLCVQCWNHHGWVKIDYGFCSSTESYRV